MAKAVNSALSVLFAIANFTEGDITLTRVARQLGLPKPSVLRALLDLEAHGLIVRDEERSIQLGFSVLTLASAFHARVPLGQRCLPYLRQLRDRTGETAALQIILGQQRSCIQQVESPADIRWAVPVGRSFPVASGAAGKVLLAHMDAAERGELLTSASYRPLTTRSRPDMAAFETELETVRRHGFAISDNETRMGASAVAAPVRDDRGRVVAAMTVAGPSDRVTTARLELLARDVVAAAAELSEELGWRNPQPKPPAQRKRPAPTRSARPKRAASDRPSNDSA